MLAHITPETRLVLIDEAQFFDPELPAVVQEILFQADVCVAGLDLDFRAKPFGSMPSLLAMADVVHKYAPVCELCGNMARFTQRLTRGKPSRANEPDGVIEGSVADIIYQARCHSCYQAPR